MEKKERYVEILEAASRVIQNKGVFKMTLENVAKEAQISKGGLLYHFKNKEMLIKSMVNYTIKQYMENVRKRAKNDEGQEGKWTRSLINEIFTQTYNKKDLNASFLIAISMNPELIDPIREAYEEWQGQIENDGLDPVDATILRLAIDGLWLSELLGLAPFDENFQQDILAKMLDKTKTEKQLSTES